MNNATSSETTRTLGEQTVRDFGEQWTQYRENEGYYASKEFLQNVAGPLLSLDEIVGKKVADIGSGTGRIVNMLLDAGARKVVAVEPSDAFDVLMENTRPRADRVEALRITGDKLPATAQVDLVVSVGVIHHIPDPAPVVKAVYDALVPGGKVLFWVYGMEGNELYLSLVNPMRKLTTRLPHFALDGLSEILTTGLDAYMAIGKRVTLPLGGYLKNVLGPCTRTVRKMTVYDQLNPAYAKYYRGVEARELLESAGFENVQLYHRHGYSWTVLGQKPTS